MKGAARILALAMGLAVTILAPGAAPAQQAEPVEGESAAELHGARPAVPASLDLAVDARGGQVYQEVCAACHDGGENRAPERYNLEQLTPEAIRRALTEGIMQPMAAGLASADLDAVSQHLAGRPFAPAGAQVAANRCEGERLRFDYSIPPPFPAWGIDHAGTHQVPDALAGIDRGNVARLELKWAFAFPEAQRVRSQPTFAGGAVFIGSHNGKVYALDAETGCERWSFQTTAEVRTGIIVSPWQAGDETARPLVFFGDMTGKAYALDAATGEEVWRIRADEHPSATLTGTPSLYNGLLYIPVSSLEEAPAAEPDYPCCSFRGSVLAVDPATGREVWRTYLVDPPRPHGRNAAGTEILAPSGVAVWSSPTIDERRGVLYVATGDNYSSPSSGMSDAIVALDLATGAIRWSYQALAGDAWNLGCVVADRSNCPSEDGPDYDFGASPVLATGRDGREYILAGQKSGMAYALDPDTGALVWEARVGRGGINGGVHFAIAAVDGLLLVPISDVPDRRTYSMPARPGVFALDIVDGREVWGVHDPGTTCEGRQFCKHGYSGAVTTTSQLVMTGGTDGFVRIFDARDGSLLWEDDTVRAFPTVNGVPGSGGAMSGGTGPVPYRGLLFVPSGYGHTSKIPGNLLLVYAPGDAAEGE